MPKASDLVNDFQRRIIKSLNVIYRQVPKDADYHERLLYKLLSRAVRYFKLHWDTLQSHEKKAVTAIRRYLLSYKLLLQSQAAPSRTTSQRYATIVDVYHGVMVTLGQMGERSGLAGFFKQFVHERQRGLVYDTFHLITQTVTVAQLSAMRERERVQRSTQVRLQQAAIHLEKAQQTLQATTKHYVKRESQYVTYEHNWVDDVVRKQLQQSPPSSTPPIATPQPHASMQEETLDSDPELASVRDYTQTFNVKNNGERGQHHRFFSYPLSNPPTAKAPGKQPQLPTLVSQIS